MEHLGLAELEAGLEEIRRSPRDHGLLEMIVARPAPGERELLQTGVLEPDRGLVGDRWRSVTGEDRDVREQLTLINARAAALVAIDPDRRALAGDQLHVDLDLSGEHLPPGTRLAIGTAVIEVSDLPHTGCGKFVRRFGVDAQKFVNSRDGRRLNLRGINALVITGGEVRVGDPVRKLPLG